MKKRICGAVCAIVSVLMCPLMVGAVNFGVRPDHPGDNSLNENPSRPHQGYLLDGPMAPDGDSEISVERPDAASFTVTFHPGDGATVSPESKRVTNGRAYGELPTPQKSGYAFQGWTNSAGIRISANTVVNLAADQKLYAVWSVRTFDVTFDANGGTVSVPGIEIPIGGNYGELPRPVRNGYSFDGWHTLPRGGERILSYEKLTRLENHTLYAHWIASPELSNEDYSATADDIFQDVPVTSIYYPAVNWAVKRGITSGTSPETFSPNDLCKRRHILTFLWRANGCPDTERAYSSVSPGTMWAYENGLIPREILYNDEEASTRSDAVTYLWKLAGSPAVDTLQSALERFTDVSPESECAPAIAWALDVGITNGTTDTTFSPDRICTRGQIVTFLYRCYR